MSVELKAPHGMIRVVRVQVAAYTHTLVGDYGDYDEACSLVDEKNAERSPSDDTWYAYDDTGQCVRGSEPPQKPVIH